MADFNRRFAVAPRNPADAHRSVLHDARELDLILCEQHVRKLTKGLTVSFEGRTYQVTGHGRGYRLHGAAVTVCKGHDGAVTVLRDGRELPVRLLGEGGDPPPVEGGKTVRSRVDLAKAAQRSRRDRKPAPDHPWRRGLQSAGAAAAPLLPPRRRNGGTRRLTKGDISALQERGHFSAIPAADRNALF